MLRIENWSIRLKSIGFTNLNMLNGHNLRFHEGGKDLNLLGNYSYDSELDSSDATLYFTSTL